jgi:hypothetical protein
MATSDETIYLRIHDLREESPSLAIGLVVLVLCVSGRAGAGGRARNGRRDAPREPDHRRLGRDVAPLEALLYGLLPVMRERPLLERLAAADARLSTATASG